LVLAVAITRTPSTAPQLWLFKIKEPTGSMDQAKVAFTFYGLWLWIVPLNFVCRSRWQTARYRWAWFLGEGEPVVRDCC